MHVIVKELVKVFAIFDILRFRAVAETDNFCASPLQNLSHLLNIYELSFEVVLTCSESLEPIFLICQPFDS